jgi:hypothetical protein
MFLVITAVQTQVPIYGLGDAAMMTHLLGRNCYIHHIMIPDSQRLQTHNTEVYFLY